jgi:biopolymer transport protein ExbD
MGYDIEIPKEAISAVPPEQSEKQIILAVSEDVCSIVEPLGPSGLPRDCRVRINKEEHAVTDLPLKMAELFRNRKAADKVLFLAAEERLNYEAIVQILDLAKTELGEDLKIGIVTDERLALAP